MPFKELKWRTNWNVVELICKGTEQKHWKPPKRQNKLRLRLLNRICSQCLQPGFQIWSNWGISPDILWVGDQSKFRLREVSSFDNHIIITYIRWPKHGYRGKRNDEIGETGETWCPFKSINFIVIGALGSMLFSFFPEQLCWTFSWCRSYVK